MKKMHLKRYLCCALKLSIKRKQDDAHDESQNKIEKKNHRKNNTHLIRKIFQSLETKQNFFSPLHFERLI